MYIPEEDSYFLLEYVKKYAKSGLKVLDMGTGSGIQARVALDNGARVLLVDIDEKVIGYLKNLGLNAVKSNLFSNISKNEKFDLIIFNPPYLPISKFDNNVDVTGGEKGSEIINRFLLEAGNYLNKKGKILLLTSSLTKNIKWQNWKKKKLGMRKFFFEELYVWELTL